MKFAIPRYLFWAALLGMTTAPAAVENTTLVVHHFLGPTSPTHRDLIVPWAERVESQSEGRIKIEIFPSMTLGGRPPELYNQVRDGFADIVWTLTGYTPGVFPRTEVFELPTVHRNSARATTQAIQDVFPLLAADFEDIEVILLHVHQGNALQMADKPIRGLQDLRRLKIRTPSRTGGWMLEAWGADAVGMPVPALPQALSKGIVDGALLPFEIMPALKLEELTRYTISAQEDVRFGTAVFLFAMNQQRYRALPADLRTVIDANSGVAIAAEVGKLWEQNEAIGRSRQQASGGEILYLDEQASAEFNAASQRAVGRWIDESRRQGIPAQELVDAARAAVQKYTSWENVPD